MRAFFLFFFVSYLSLLFSGRIEREALFDILKTFTHENNKNIHRIIAEVFSTCGISSLGHFCGLAIQLRKF